MEDDEPNLWIPRSPFLTQQVLQSFILALRRSVYSDAMREYLLEEVKQMAETCNMLSKSVRKFMKPFNRKVADNSLKCVRRDNTLQLHWKQQENVQKLFDSLRIEESLVKLLSIVDQLIEIGELLFTCLDGYPHRPVNAQLVKVVHFKYGAPSPKYQADRDSDASIWELDTSEIAPPKVCGYTPCLAYAYRK